MLIRRVKMDNFFGITDEVEFPEIGTLLVTGPNGSGKSARCYDASSWAGWKHTVRGTPPQAKHSSVPSVVSLTTDKVDITRSTKSGLTWNHIGFDPVVYETPTKTADALTRVIGDHSAWQRTHVFRTRDTDLFTGASDGDRKRLIEKLTGIDIFDEAYKIVSKKHSDRGNVLNNLLLRKKQLETRIDETRQHAIDLKAFASKSLRDPDEIRQQMTALAEKRGEHQCVYREAGDEITRANAYASMTARQQVQHTDGKCYACGQRIPPETLLKQAEDLAVATKAANDAEYNNRGRMQDAARALGECDIALRQLQDELANSSTNRMAADKMATLKERFNADKSELADLQIDIDFLQEDEDVTAHALRFLGIKGPRSRILSSALQKLEDRSNLYLSWINSKARISIQGFSEQANGKTNNKINIDIDGYGGGHGYEACSGGQQRRIDLVMLLALASLSETQGTLFFDEAFDALDQEGCASAVELLSRMSENRPVVIIAHNPMFIQSLRGPRLVLTGATE